MILSAVLTIVTAATMGSLKPTDLRCEYLADATGIDAARPRLSWKLEPTDPKAHGLRQSAYRIVVSSNGEGKPDLWDSGRVESADTTAIEFAGKRLVSGQQCWWKVQVWDQDNKPSDWSATAKWSMGLLSPNDWKAKWIGYDAPVDSLNRDSFFGDTKWIWFADDKPGEAPKAARFFKASFDAKTKPKKAELRVSADDQFELFINGTKAAQSDGETDAWRRPQKIDAAKFLKQGRNEITIRAENTAVGSAGLIFKLVADEAVFESDSSWQASDNENGPFKAAKEIANYGDDPWGSFETALVLPPPRFLRKEFEADKKIKRAVVYYSALGLAEIHINGKKISEDTFVPGWSDYDKRVYYRANEVTSLIRKGKNAIGAILGDGWYAGYIGYGHKREHYGAHTRLLAQLEIEYEDGTRATIASSPDWKATTGPILESDFLMGETYDARRELTGWDSPGYDDAKWRQADQSDKIESSIESFPGVPVRTIETLKAKKITEPKKGAYVLNLGQNIAGFARIRIKGEHGQKITLRFAERLNPDGTIYTANLRGARAIDTYICKGEGIETWQPRFTFHGFQYIEVTGLKNKPQPNEVVGIAVSSDTPLAGSLTTSDRMLNQLTSNALWTQRMNFIDIPTDCPQRDERLGWTGDAQAYIRTACMFTDVQAFFTKWLVALDDAQRADGQFPMVAPLKVAGGDGGPAWADAGVICPWTIYDVYGDKQLLAKHYPAMKRFIEFCKARCTADLLPPAEFHCFGDWLNIGSPTPHEVIFEAYFAGSTKLLAKSAAALGMKEDEAKYNELFDRIKSAFNAAYVSADGMVKGDSQCAYVLALGFDLLDGTLAKKAAERLVADIEKRNWHLSTGFVGTRDIMHVLSKIGRNDVAFRLLHNKTFPSWGFTIANGATSIWERWDGWTPDKGFQDPGMNSFAHYAFGAVAGWMFQQLAGIQSIEPGFAHIRIAPQIDPNLKWLHSSYDSIRGKIVSEWSVSNGVLTMKVVVPPNTKAEIRVPGSSVKSSPALEVSRVDSGVAVFDVGSGEYEFVAKAR